MPPTTLDIQAVDVTATAWDSLVREVLADEPDALALLFLPEGGEIRAHTTDCGCGNGGCGSCDCFGECIC